MEKKTAVLLFLSVFLTALFASTKIPVLNVSAAELDVPIVIYSKDKNESKAVLAEEDTNPTQIDTVESTGDVTIVQDVQTPESTQSEEEKPKFDCQAYRLNLQEKIYAMQLLQILHVENYQYLYNRLNAIAQKADLMGFDTRQLYTDLRQLNTQINTFSQNYAALENELVVFSQIDCTNLTERELENVLVNGEIQNPFARFLTQAQTRLATLRQNASQISYFYYNTLREDVLNLQPQEKL